MSKTSPTYKRMIVLFQKIQIIDNTITDQL